MVTGYVWMVTGEPLGPLHFFNQKKKKNDFRIFQGAGRVPQNGPTGLEDSKILTWILGVKNQISANWLPPLWQLHLLTKQYHSLFQVAPDSRFVFPSQVWIFGEAFVSCENTQRIPNGQQKRRSNRDVQNTPVPWEPTVPSIFRGYNPYIGGSKPSFFTVLGAHGK